MAELNPLRTYLGYDADLYNDHRNATGRELHVMEPDQVYWFAKEGMRQFLLIQRVIDSIRAHAGMPEEIYWSLDQPTPATDMKSGDSIGYPRVIRLNDGRYVIIFPTEWFYHLRTFFIAVCCTKAARRYLDIPVQSIHGPMMRDGEWVKPALAEGEKLEEETVVMADTNSMISGPLETFACGEILWESAIACLVSHEVAHVLHGHLQLGSPNAAAVISEADGGANADAMVSRALEFDADCMGVSSIFANLLSRVGTTYRPPYVDDAAAAKGFTYAIDTPQKALLLTATATYGLFRFFQPEGTVAGDLWKTTHPPLLFRAFVALFQTRTLNQARGGGIENIEETVLWPAINLIERGIEFLKPDHRPPEDLARIDTIVSDYMTKISPTWNAIRDELEARKHGGTIAPPHEIREPDAALCQSADRNPR